ncbi:hypothetical protein [Simiduia agarivorans]|nr:hypothetical protein [Simiduia agarivorans]
MFRLLMCSLLLVALIARAETPAHTDHNTTAVHGMVLFGDEPLYASHLGLYHHPHDRQIVMPVRFDVPAEAQAFRQWREQFDGLITLAPKPFALADLNPAGRFPFAIVVDIYAGHFERGGEQQFSDVTLLLDQPLIYRHLQADGERDPRARFWQLPGKHGDFLVYRIGPKPDQDWILQTDALLPCAKAPCDLTIALPAGPQLSAGETLPVLVDDKLIPLPIKKSLYQEHKDFSF